MVNSENPQLKPKIIQLNLSTTATLGTEESGHCREVLNKSQCMDSLRTADVFPVVEATTGNVSAVCRLMYGLSAKKVAVSGEVAVSGGSTVKLCHISFTGLQ